MLARPKLLLPLALAASVAGCSSFRGDSRAARSRVPSEGSPEGLWVGRWHDAKNPNHGGELQCVLTAEGHNLYRASTRATWWGIFRSAYDTTLVLTPTAPGAYLAQGGDTLWLFGVYAMTGRVDNASFTARYRAGGHEGVMELARPEVAAP